MAGNRKRRPDAGAHRNALEIERSGSLEGLKKAVLRLKASKKPRKVLYVPQAHMGKAVEAMQAVGVSGTVKNLSGTKRRLVRSSPPASMIRWSYELKSEIPFFKKWGKVTVGPHIQKMPLR